MIATSYVVGFQPFLLIRYFSTSATSCIRNALLHHFTHIKGPIGKRLSFPFQPVLNYPALIDELNLDKSSAGFSCSSPSAPCDWVNPDDKEVTLWKRFLFLALCIFAALPFPVSFFDEWPLNPKWLTLET
jgi:hypothetical protein